jgi:hypothetical protein
VRVFVRHADLVDDLVRSLETMRCNVERAGPNELDVTVPGAAREDAARLELDLYLRVWEATRPGARARRVD